MKKMKMIVTITRDQMRINQHGNYFWLDLYHVYQWPVLNKKAPSQLIGSAHVNGCIFCLIFLYGHSSDM